MNRTGQGGGAAFLQDLIELEVRRGCHDDAAVGGFAQLVLAALPPPGKNTGKTAAAILSQRLQSLFTDYAFQQPKERRARCDAALELLAALPAGASRPASSGQKKPAPVVSAPSLFDFLERPVTGLRGVGPHLEQTFARIGIASTADLLQDAPKRYLDLRQLTPLSRDVLGRDVFVRAQLLKVMEIRRRTFLVKGMVREPEGHLLHVIWFNNRFVRSRLQPGHTYDFYGRLENSFDGLQLVQPLFEESGTPAACLHMNRLVPVYHLTSGLTQKGLRTHLWHALEDVPAQPPDYLPGDVARQFQLPGLAGSYRSLHFPADEKAAELARRRFAFDSLFLFELCVLQHRRREEKATAPLFELPAGTVRRYAAGLPFQATRSQLGAMQDIEADLKGTQRMHRLLHGDVGSGKTAVAGYAVYAAKEAGFQSAVLSPTEILAQQTGAVLSSLLAPFQIRVATLTGGTPRVERRKILTALVMGDIQCLVGTHALLEEGVAFERLGLTVVDEQHRFGVVQRKVLGEKGDLPHALVMSATPIPRTLALTIYGDLDISELTEKPPGRHPIRTMLATAAQRGRVYALVREQIEQGRQAFVVVPAIDAASGEEDVASVEKVYEELHATYLPGLRIAFLHGRLKAKEKEAVMEAFRQQQTDVLVATTVVEVGVDVPNATVMVVENAERFGLATLHQLRGRVGRSSFDSFCFLIQGSGQPESAARLQVLVDSEDGFHIAEEDLKQRGPGDILGTVQHGYDVPGFGSTALLRYQDLNMLPAIRSTALALLKEDPLLDRPEHAGILRMLRLRYPENRSPLEEN